MPRSRMSSLKRGDVIKTHPREGFWGVAVVLTAPFEEAGLRARCHIGITSLVLKHDFEWGDIAGTQLSILEFERGVRTGPMTYTTRLETCIGQYVAETHPSLPVLGNVDPTPFAPAALTTEVGDGTNGKYPLCGPITAHLGGEAVSNWLRMHDPAQWLREVEAARASFENVEARRLEDERGKRHAQRKRGRGA